MIFKFVEISELFRITLGYAANCIRYILGGTQTQTTIFFIYIWIKINQWAAVTLFSVLWVHDQVKVYLYSRIVFSNKAGPDPKCLLGTRHLWGITYGNTLGVLFSKNNSKTKSFMIAFRCHSMVNRVDRSQRYRFVHSK